jgi:Predicted nucleic acid-binding protein, contains PIN domain
MTTYLLDTNACIALINGKEANVRRRFQRAVAQESVILLSSIVAFELWHGVAKSQRKESNIVRLDAFLAGPPRVDAVRRRRRPRSRDHPCRTRGDRETDQCR